MGLKRHIITSILSSIPVLLGATFITFLLLYISGNPVYMLLGEFATPEEVERVSKSLGLDKPIPVQYFLWLKRVISGDLGTSIMSRLPVSMLIIERIVPTLMLTISALLVSLIVGVTTGILSAIKQQTWIDYTLTFLSLLSFSIPYFWLAMLLVWIFGVYLGWFPVAGSMSIQRLILPSLALGLPQAAVFTRITRSSMLEVLNQDFIRTARAKGLMEKLVIYRHALKNALLPIIALTILRIPWLIGGAFITETIFAWPGMGTLLVNSIYKRDFPVVQGIVLIITVLVIVSDIIGDIVNSLVDPRIRYE